MPEVTFAIGEHKNSVTLKDTIWTRGLFKEWLSLSRTDEQENMDWVGQYVDACNIIEPDGTCHTEWAELTSEVLDRLHPALLRFLFGLPSTMREKQASMGELSGGL